MLELREEERESDVESVGPPLLLRPDSGLFAAYQRSLSQTHQAALARWAAGAFRASDGRCVQRRVPCDGTSTSASGTLQIIATARTRISSALSP